MAKGATLRAEVVESHLTFEEFFRREYSDLAAALYLLTRNRGEAEDLAQEAMARVLERWDRVREMESAVGYLYRTALNLNRKRLRGLSRAASGAVSGFLPQNAEEVVADRSELAEMLSVLPRQQRAVLVLVEALGFSPTEVAEIYRMKPGTVRVSLSRARATIRARGIQRDA